MGREVWGTVQSSTQMLLTLNTSCVRTMFLGAGRSKKPRMDLLDLPAFARDTLGLAGINLTTDLLAGADRARLESIRERADRASCACLLLIESEGVAIAAANEEKHAAAVTRLTRVVEAAHILGSSSVACTLIGTDDENAMTRASTGLRKVMERADKLDLSLLISPGAGLTSKPERVTELLKKIGGFRVGTFPDFETASKSPDAIAYLQRLTPYAMVVCASSGKFGLAKSKDETPVEQLIGVTGVEHRPYDLRAMIKAIGSVGYEGPLALDYRGGGDVVAGIALTRDHLRAAIGGTEVDPPDDDDLADVEDDLPLPDVDE